MEAINANLGERREIMNKNGEKLVGLLHDADSKGLVVICHGFICTKENGVTQGLTYNLQRAGISTFRFDFSGNGESEGEFQYSNYDKEVEDLRSVIEHFRTQESRETVAIVGYSKGGTVVLLYASKYNDIGLVVNVSGRFYMHEGNEFRLGENYMERIQTDGFIEFQHENKNYYRATWESLQERLGIDMATVCLSIDEGCRVVTIHGSKDEIVKIKDAKKFDEVIPNHYLHTIRRAKHGYVCHKRQLSSAVVSSIMNYMVLLPAHGE